MTPELGLLWRGPTRLGKVPWHRQHGGWHVRERVMMITRSQNPSHPLAAPWAGKGLTSCCLSPLWKNSLGQTSAVMTESWLAEVILGLCGRYIGHQGNHKSWINNPVLIVEIYKMKKKLFKLWPSLLSISAALAQKNPENVPIACSGARSECRARSCQYEKRERAGLVSAPRIGEKKRRSFLSEEVLDIQWYHWPDASNTLSIYPFQNKDYVSSLWEKLLLMCKGSQ